LSLEKTITIPELLASQALAKGLSAKIYVEGILGWIADATLAHARKPRLSCRFQQNILP